jgi:hypothetical protein
MKRFVLVLRIGTCAERAGLRVAHGVVLIALPEKSLPQLEMHHD